MNSEFSVERGAGRPQLAPEHCPYPKYRHERFAPWFTAQWEVYGLSLCVFAEAFGSCRAGGYFAAFRRGETHPGWHVAYRLGRALAQCGVPTSGMEAMARAGWASDTVAIYGLLANTLPRTWRIEDVHHAVFLVIDDCHYPSGPIDPRAARRVDDAVEMWRTARGSLVDLRYPFRQAFFVLRNAADVGPEADATAWCMLNTWWLQSEFDLRVPSFC